MRLVSTVMVLPRINFRLFARATRTAGPALVAAFCLAGLTPLLSGCTAAKKSAPPPASDVVVVAERNQEPVDIPEVTEWPYAETPPVPDGFKVHKRIKDLTFPAGSAGMNAEARGAMTEAIRELTTNSAWHVLSVGFADGQGESAKLAQSRAAAVSKLLKSGGIDASRLSTLGLGSAYAEANEFEPGQLELDRRVEVWAFRK